MIIKLEGYINGYELMNSSTNREFQEILKKYDKVSCLLCNSRTRYLFIQSLFSDSGITINNKIKDNQFFINKFM